MGCGFESELMRNLECVVVIHTSLLPPSEYSIFFSLFFSIQGTKVYIHEIISLTTVKIRVSFNATQTFEAKNRLAGTYNRSTFDELTDPKAIRAQIQRYLPDARVEKENFGLDIFAQLVTTRQVYVADERFTVVLDQTDFGHSVGEVELEAEDAEKAHRDIDAFLKKYSWFCESGSVEGKLSAYFRLRGDKLREMMG